MRYLTIVLTLLVLLVLLGHPLAICNAPITSDDDEKDTSVFRPMIYSQDVAVDPIMNNADPVFKVRGFCVRIPGLLRRDSAQVCTIEVGIDSSKVRDLKTDSTYSVIVFDVEPLRQLSIESIQRSRDYWFQFQHQRNQRQLPKDSQPEPPMPPPVNPDTLRYCAMVKTTLKVVGGKIPLTRGQVKGLVYMTVTATYVDTMGVVHRRSKTRPIMISN